MVVLAGDGGAGGAAGSAWAIPTAAQKPATVTAAAVAIAFVDFMTVQLSCSNHRAGNPDVEDEALFGEWAELDRDELLGARGVRSVAGWLSLDQVRCVPDRTGWKL